MTDSTAGSLDLSVVVPFYDPGDAVRTTIAGLAEGLAAAGRSFEVIAVSDGSTDPTPESLADLGVPQLRIEALDRNRGKGAALRAGMGLAKGDYVGFIDADGDIPPAALVDLAAVVARDRPDAVLGSKPPDVRRRMAPIRRFGSSLWRRMVLVLFGFSADTQTGVKLFRAEVVRDALPQTSLDGFAFDLELIVIARNLGYTTMPEVPVAVTRRGKSTVSLGTAARMLYDLWTIFWNVRVRRRGAMAPPVPTRGVRLSGAETEEG
jgi:glycosyltransferase involved in cell wall biosynthesis